jgi:hypothetical protein
VCSQPMTRSTIGLANVPVVSSHHLSRRLQWPDRRTFSGVLHRISPHLAELEVDEIGFRRSSPAQHPAGQGSQVTKTLWARTPAAFQLPTVFPSAVRRELGQTKAGGIDLISIVAMFDAASCFPSWVRVAAQRQTLVQPAFSCRAISACGILYRPRFLRHRIEAYAARAADGSWLCRTAFGV